MLPLRNTFDVMITILKETPITFKGCDALELLVLNDELCDEDICVKCAYSHYVPDLELHANCVDVHGCTENPQAYYVIIS